MAAFKGKDIKKFWETGRILYWGDLASYEGT